MPPRFVTALMIGSGYWWDHDKPVPPPDPTATPSPGPHDLLGEAEKALLDRCSVFAGGFDLQSALRGCGLRR